MKAVFIIISVIILVGCNRSKGSDANSDEEIDTSAFAQQLEITNEEVVLLPEAREHVVTWVNYITAQNEIDNLRGASVNQVIENARPLSQIMKSLQTSVPDSLQSTAVNARINVLVTKTQVLEQLAARRNKNAEKIAQTASEIPDDFNNFKLQLNELFLKSLEDFEKELDEMEAEMDSTRIQDSI